MNELCTMTASSSRARRTALTLALCAALLCFAGCATTQQRAGSGQDVATLAGAGNVAAQADVETLRQAMVGVVNTVDRSARSNDDWSFRLAIGGVVLAPMIYPLGKALWLVLPAVSRWAALGRKRNPGGAAASDPSPGQVPPGAAPPP